MGVTALSTLAACTGSDKKSASPIITGPGGVTVSLPKNYSSTFCGKAREFNALQAATDRIADSGPENIKKVMGAYLDSGIALTDTAPQEIKSVVKVYAQSLVDTKAALERLKYNLAELLNDADYKAKVITDANATAENDVNQYLVANCLPVATGTVASTAQLSTTTAAKSEMTDPVTSQPTLPDVIETTTS